MSRRRSFTQPQRLSIYRLRLEAATLPNINSPSWHWSRQVERDAIRASIYRLMTELSLLGSNPGEAARNARWSQINQRLKVAVILTDRRRRAEVELAKLANVVFPNKFQRALAEIDIRFGGKTAEYAMRGAA